MDDNFGAVPKARGKLAIQTLAVNSSSGENKLLPDEKVRKMYVQGCDTMNPKLSGHCDEVLFIIGP